MCYNYQKTWLVTTSIIDRTYIKRRRKLEDKIMAIMIKPVNEFTVCDENITIMILKAPKRRYRNIIKAHHRELKSKR